MNTKSESPKLPPIEVPVASLSAEALSAIIEDFILREGTDYGAIEVSHQTKVQQVERQLQKGEVKIVFDAHTESVTLMSKRDLQKMSN